MTKPLGIPAASARTVPNPPTIDFGAFVQTSNAYNNAAFNVTLTPPTWDGKLPVTGYAFNIVTPTIASFSSATNVVSITGLQSATTYAYNVTCSNAIGPSATGGASNLTVVTVPDRPTFGSASNVNGIAYGTTPQITLSWNAPANGGAAITGYQYSTNNGTNWTNIGSVTSITLTNQSTGTAFSPGTNYSFILRAINSSGTGLQTLSAVSATAFTVPERPTIGSVSRLSNTQVRIPWTAGNNGGSGLTSLAITSSPSIALTYTNTDLDGSIDVTGNFSQSQSYTFTMTNSNASGTSLSSVASNSVIPYPSTPPPPPPPPPIIAVTPPPPPIIAVTPPIIAVTPPIIAVTPPIIAVTPPIIAVTPPIIAVTPPPPLYCDPETGFCYSIGSDTRILTLNGYKKASELEVGDELLSLDVSEIPTDGALFDMPDWNSETFTNNGVVTTTVKNIMSYTGQRHVQINGDWFSDNHYVLVRKDGISQFKQSIEIDNSYEIFNYQLMDWIPVVSVDVLVSPMVVYSIDCEPYDIFFTENMLVYNLKENKL